MGLKREVGLDQIRTRFSASFLKRKGNIRKLTPSNANSTLDPKFSHPQNKFFSNRQRKLKEKPKNPLSKSIDSANPKSLRYKIKTRHEVIQKKAEPDLKSYNLESQKAKLQRSVEKSTERIRLIHANLTLDSHRSRSPFRPTASNLIFRPKTTTNFVKRKPPSKSGSRRPKTQNSNKVRFRNNPLVITY